MLVEMVEKYGADALIYCQMKFCDPEEFDYPLLYTQLENKDIRNLMIEIDQQANSLEQIRTRVQSFAEMM